MAGVGVVVVTDFLEEGEEEEGEDLMVVSDMDCNQKE